MGKNSRRHHVDKQRRAADRRRQSERLADRREPERDHALDAPVDPVSAACTKLENVFGLVLRDGLWARGWQPDEVLRHVRREGSMTPVHIGLLATAIAADAAHHDRVGNDVHASWRRQTDRVGALAAHDPTRDGWVARWLSASGDGAGLLAARTLLDELLKLPSLPMLVPPPGSTDALLADLRETDSEPSPTLARIRALLAKAESTPFPAEAEAFTAKAQAMMTAARIDDAVVRAGSGRRSTGRVSAVRIALDDPYVASKQALLVAVAEANDVRCEHDHDVRPAPRCRGDESGDRSADDVDSGGRLRPRVPFQSWRRVTDPRC